MTVPTRPRSGVVLCGVIDGDAEGWRLQWQRAPDDGGAPGTWATIETLDAGERRLVDTDPSVLTVVGGSVDSYWYRYRTVRGECSTPGAWSDPIHMRPAYFPDRLPDCPGAPAGPPSLALEQSASTIITETWEATPAQHPESDAGGGGLEVRFRLRREGRGFGGWQPASGGDGWTPNTPLSIVVQRLAHARQYLQVQARDTHLRGRPESDPQTVMVKPVIDMIDLPPLGRGPLEDDRTRDGIGGQAPGGGRTLAPVGSRRGDVTMVDTGGRNFGEGTVQSSAFLGPGVQASDGLRAGFLNKATEITPASKGKHDLAINFQENYQNEPAIIPLPGYLTSHANLGSTQYPDVRAVDVSPSGMRVHALLREPTSGGSTQSVDFESATIAGVGQDEDDWVADKDDASDSSDAADQKYTFFGSITAIGIQTAFGCSNGSITLGLYTNDGGGWIHRASVSQSANCTSQQRDVEETISVGGLGTRTGPEFAVGVESEVGSGGFYSMDRVEWMTGASGGATEDATQGGDLPVRFAVYAKADS